MPEEQQIITIEDILHTALDAGASDVHITAGIPPKMRVNGRLVALDMPVLTPDDTMNIARGIMSPQQVERDIRLAIASGWKHGDRRTWERFFPGETKVPSNDRFLRRMADALRL